jgi:putative membrane protein
MATGGKILGIANVLQQSISQHNSLLQMMGWGCSVFPAFDQLLHF